MQVFKWLHVIITSFLSQPQ